MPGIYPTPERCNGRNRRCSESPEGDENSEVDSASSTPETQDRESRLRHKTLKGHPCPAPSCAGNCKRVQSLYRHIRQQTDTAHKKLPEIIKETQCSVCGKKFKRPTGLVRHERETHREIYKSRLKKVLDAGADCRYYRRVRSLFILSLLIPTL